MAIRVEADIKSIIFPPTLKPPIEIGGKSISLVVNTSRVGLPVSFESKKSDIELVQFYLSEFIDTSPGTILPIKLLGFKIDGILGDQTNMGIKFFQSTFLKKPDGIVSKPTISHSRPQEEGVNHLTISSFSQARTILLLGLRWKTFNPNKDITSSFKIALAPHLHSELTKDIPKEF